MEPTIDFTRAEAERIVEGLRSGVPFPSLAEKLPIGRDALLAEVRTRLAQPSPAPLTVRANYGDGKTHFLQAVAGAAGAAGYVVSSVAVSREAPMSNLDQLYQRLVAGTIVPGSSLFGIQPILERLRGKGDMVGERLTAGDIPERFRVAVAAYLQDDLRYREELLEDLSGQAIMTSRLRTILRDLFGRRQPIEKFMLSRDPIWLYRMLGQLIELAGYPGWVVLLDELELIGKTGLGARARAYANLAALTPAYGGPPHTLLVLAVASNFYTDVLEEKRDSEQAPEWLLARGHADQAEQARRGLRILTDAVRLPPLLPAEIERLLAAVRTAHALAYDWEPPPLTDLLGAVRRYAKASDAKLRTRIRVAVQWLDLWMQYGEEPEMSVWQVGETDLVEEASPPAPDEEVPTVTRRPIFGPWGDSP